VLVEVTAKLQGIHRDHDQCKVARSGATNSSHCIGFLKEYIATDYPLPLFFFISSILAYFLHRRNLLLLATPEDLLPSLSLYGWNQAAALFGPKTPAAFVRSDFEHSVVICDRCIYFLLFRSVCMLIILLLASSPSPSLSGLNFPAEGFFPDWTGNGGKPENRMNSAGNG